MLQNCRASRCRDPGRASLPVRGGRLNHRYEQQIESALPCASALPLKADMCSATAHVCFGPIADIAGSSFCRIAAESEERPGGTKGGARASSPVDATGDRTVVESNNRLGWPPGRTRTSRGLRRRAQQLARQSIAVGYEKFILDPAALVLRLSCLQAMLIFA
jgi:hypothetical protein